MKSSRMTTYILVAMVLGIAVGGVIHWQITEPATQKLLAGYISIGSMIFLRLIKMIIAPLVFSTLVVGIGHMSDAGTVGRVGGKAMLLVRHRLARLAEPRPDPGQLVRAGRRRAQGRHRRQLAASTPMR